MNSLGGKPKKSKFIKRTSNIFLVIATALGCFAVIMAFAVVALLGIEHYRSKAALFQSKSQTIEQCVDSQFTHLDPDIIDALREVTTCGCKRLMHKRGTYAYIPSNEPVCEAYRKTKRRF